MTQRFGVADIGSNAIRYQIVEVGAPTAAPRVLVQARHAVRVGAGVFTTGLISDEAIEQAAVALREFHARCRTLDVQTEWAIATSATRCATNAAALVESARGIAGIDVDIISGEREAGLLRAAIEARVDLGACDGTSLLADLGAGSLELVALAGERALTTASYPLGSLRLFDRLGAAACRLGKPLLTAIHALLDDAGGDAAKHIAGAGAARLLGVGGAVEIVADLEAAAGQRVSGPGGIEVLSASALHTWSRELADRTVEQRIEQYGLLPDRADIIVVAVTIYGWIADRAGLDVVLVPRVSLRDGMVAELRAR